MNHQGTKVIETQRLILRPFAATDAQAMYNNWASDPEASKFLTWQPHVSVEETGRLLADDWIPQYTKQDYYHWAIELKEIGQIIGSIGSMEQKEQVQTAEIGYCIGKQWWNQGLMTEALAAVMAYLFEEVGINRLELRHDTNNPASGRVMAKCGLQLEGIHRQAGHNNQGVCDSAIYAILAEGYHQS